MLSGVNQIIYVIFKTEFSHPQKILRLVEKEIAILFPRRISIYLQVTINLSLAVEDKNIKQ